MSNPPRLTFTSLAHRVLSTFSTDDVDNSTDALTLLNHHKQQLLDTLFSFTTSSKSDEKVSYYRYAEITAKYPTPTEQETSCIQSLQTHFAIPPIQAANLIRDYLAETSTEHLESFLESQHSLSTLAPLHLLNNYWLRQCHAALSMLVSLFIAASDSKHKHLHQPASTFISQNENNLKQSILQAAIHVISSFSDNTSNSSKPSSSSSSLLLHANWYMRLLFASSLLSPLSIDSRESLLSAYCKVAEHKQRFSKMSPSDEVSRPSIPTLDGGEASVLFVATINHANSIRQFTEAFSTGHISNEISTLIDDNSMYRLDSLYIKLRCDPSPETVLLILSWASLRQLRLHGHCSLPFPTDNSTGEEESTVMEHMSFAIANNVFTMLQNIVDEMRLPHVLSVHVHRCFWDDVVAFFSAYPPRDFLPRQVSQMVVLATSLLRSLERSDLIDVTRSLWTAEKSQCSLIGANSILRIAVGVFPQTYRPLINFVTALVVDEESAREALSFLCECLTTITESSSNYQDVLFVLDDDESDILQSISFNRQLDVNTVTKTLEMVRFNDQDIVFVQAGEDIPSDTYRPKISKGSIGLSDVTLSVATWIIPWNGFGAVGRILQYLRSMFKDQDSAAVHDDFVLEELVVTATDSMQLIDRLFAMASAEVAHEYLADVELVKMIASIVAECADPGDMTRSKWLTKARQQKLLMAGVSCLVSITSKDPERARIALDTLELTKSTYPLYNTVSTLTTASFPVVAAVARIAFVAAHSDVMSVGLREVLAASSPRGNGRFSSTLWFGKDSSGILEFIKKNVLPLWFTSSSSFNGDVVKHSGSDRPDLLHWLLPTCSLELFMADPISSLQSPIMSSLFSTIISTVCDESELDRLIDGLGETGAVVDTFLFPALRAALTACYIALRERNKFLMDNNQGKSNEECSTSNENQSKLSADEITYLENTLLKPDIVNAMALLSSGLVKKFKHDVFFEQATKCPFGGYISKLDSDLFWTLCPDWKERDANNADFWRTWVTGMSARCLALQFCCLSQLRRSDDTIQVAWPSTQQSLIGIWRGGGGAIRKAFAKMIENNRSVPHIELLVTILACGQRAAARSLLAPTSTSMILRRLSSNKDKEQSSANKDETDEKDNNEVMKAVVKCLQDSHIEWMNKADELIKSGEDVDISKYIGVGQMCLKIAACVRFLRVAWGSQNSRWFESSWNDLKVWEVIANLVRCKGSNSRDPLLVDFAQAIDYPEVTIVSKERLKREDSNNWSTLQSLAKDIAVAVDVSACWKVIAADVLEMFSAEISLKTTAYLKAPKPENKNSNAPDESKDSLPAEVFKEGVFAQFSSVFTEKWMHVLFKLSDNSDETSSALERIVSRKSLTDVPSRTGKKGISVEDRSRQVSKSLTNLIFSSHKLNSEHVIQFFDRGGDVNTRFGADYCFDSARLLRFLQMAGRSVEEACDILKDFSRLNMDMTLQDVQAQVVRAFSAMSSAIVFADSFCPQPVALLSYSSPQFGGKVCRFLSRYLLFISPMLTSSGHAVGITSEISMLMASLSTRLSNDELDQPALTAVRFQSLVLPEELSSLNVSGQICVIINDVMDSIRGMMTQVKKSSQRLDIVRWLLLTASKLSKGAAFRSRSDLMALTRCVMRVLRESGEIPFVSSACSVALSSILDQNLNGWTASLDSDDVKILVKTISSLSSLPGQERNICREISANLLLIIAQGYFLQGSVDKETRSFVIRQLTGGAVMGMLSSESETIATYDSNSELRNSAHVLWCSCLRLAGVAISDAMESQKYGGGNDEIRDVLEFSCSTINRIGRDSLNLSGDWPSYQGMLDQHDSKFLTIAKVEEAELSALAVFKLSGYAFYLRNIVPESLKVVVGELVRYTDHALRLLRAEPVERFVRPITRQERERSFLLRGERDSHGNLISTGASPLWSGSPGGRNVQTPGSPSPVKRSPMQALRAAIGDGSNRGSPTVPPSPLFTPGSPLIGMPGSGHMQSSPLSPWIPYGAGLISETGLYFGEEVSRSLLRGLVAALTSLRRFTTEMEVALFSINMNSYEDPPGLGTLTSILHHAGGELHRGTDDTRRQSLLTIAENAFILIIFHIRFYMEQNALPQHVRDELRKRIPTYILRMRRCVPPPPSSSIISNLEIDSLWEQLR